MGRGVDWSLADMQFVRDGMTGGANLSLLARTAVGLTAASEKLVRRIMWRSGIPEKYIPPWIFTVDSWIRGQQVWVRRRERQ